MSELDREAEQAIDYLGDSEEQDNLPESPPDVRSRATEWGTTAAEQSAEETKSIPAGRVSLMVTPVAVSGPLLVTLSS